MQTQDHPRIRGTNLSSCSAPASMIGSSPHTRDKSPFTGDNAVLPGIIPAYAGQISEAPVRRIWRRDHPRIRGTNQSAPSSSINLLGSPPHTRDKSQSPYFIHDILGITPAYAGQIVRNILAPPDI